MSFEELSVSQVLKDNLSSAVRSGRFPHACVFEDEDPERLRQTADAVACALVCTSDDKPCLKCPGCLKARAGCHPDIRVFSGGETPNSFKVETVREIRSDAYVVANEAPRKVYILENAHNMSAQAQNALLKILEEPPAYAAFLILSDRAEKLLPTIRSRCAELHLAPAPQTEGLAFLRGKYPDRAEPELERAFRRAGGYLGQAIQLLSGEGQAPQTAQFAACYAARNALALLELLLPMEKWKREQLIPVLEQLREYLAELLMLRSGLGTPDDTQKKILQGRTGAELLAAANNLQTAIDDLNANVGAGAVIGWLSLQLR